MKEYEFKNLKYFCDELIQVFEDEMNGRIALLSKDYDDIHATIVFNDDYSYTINPRYNINITTTSNNELVFKLNYKEE